jgi:serine/threonine protein kinase
MSADRSVGAAAGPRSVCPGDETVARFVRGSLPSAEDVDVRGHIDECADCRRLISDVALLDNSAAPNPSMNITEPAALTRQAQAEHILGPGAVIGEKYQVTHVLGTGGMGKVLAARHLELGQTVAIKVMHPELAADGDSVSRFLREGRAAALLKSDHAIRIHDVGRLPSGVPYLVMEHLEGEDLEALRKRRHLSVAEVVDFILQAITAIAEAHERGLVHRDIKPHNLFLVKLPDGSSRVKVLDFGLAKDLQTSGSGSALTTEHMILGSPSFMSPEQIRTPNHVDARADVWALGATMYQLLANQAPYAALNVHGLLARILADPAPRVRDVREDVPVAIENVIVRCMEKDLTRRYGSVLVLADDLRAAVGWTTERATAHAAPPTEREEPRSTERMYSPDAVTQVMARDDSGAATLTSATNTLAIATTANPETERGHVNTLAMPPAFVAAVDAAVPVRVATLPSREAEAPKHKTRIARRWLGAFVIVTVAAGAVLGLAVRASQRGVAKREANASASASANVEATPSAATSVATAPRATATSAAPAPSAVPAPSATASATTKRPTKPATTAMPTAKASSPSPYEWGR